VPVDVVDEDARVTPSEEDAEEAGLRVRRVGRANATRPGSYPPIIVAYKTLVGGRIIIRGYPTTQPENKMQSTLLLDIIIRKRTSILKLLPSTNQTLLIRRNPLLSLNLALDIVDGIRRLNLQGNRLASQRLDENLHATTETEDKVQGRLLLDIVVGEGPAVFKLFAGKDEALLGGRDALLVLDLRLDVVDRVGGLDLKRDGCEDVSRRMFQSGEGNEEG
jgi:hypothetical protein